jgi:hypothetical protein
VLPVIVDHEHRVSLACELEDGSFVYGQSEISHPVRVGPAGLAPLVVSKDEGERLASPIRRVFYTHGSSEVVPAINCEVLQHLAAADLVVYGMGSLYTSLAPALVLPGVGETIRASAAPKLLLLNGSHDRESFGMSASQFVQAVTNALNRSGSPLSPVAASARRPSLRAPPLSCEPAHYVTMLAVPCGGAVPLDRSRLLAMGISRVLEVASEEDSSGRRLFQAKALGDLLVALRDGTGEEPSSSFRWL